MARTRRCPHCRASVPREARFCQDCGREVTRGASGGNRAIALLVAAVIVLAGAGYLGVRLSRPAAPQAQAQRERPTEIAGLGPMPVWLRSADRQVQDDYIWAAEHLAELQYIPCYCGCGQFGHKDNFGCYFTRDARDVVTGYDNHAVG